MLRYCDAAAPALRGAARLWRGASASSSASAPRAPHPGDRIASQAGAQTARPLNEVSATVTQPRSRGASQAMLRGAGLTGDDLNRAQVGICSVWWEGNPCNSHLLALSEHVKAGVAEAGLVGLRFNTCVLAGGEAACVATSALGARRPAACSLGSLRRHERARRLSAH
jgi:hypothetical protein